MLTTDSMGTPIGRVPAFLSRAKPGGLPLFYVGGARIDEMRDSLEPSSLNGIAHADMFL